MGVLANNDRQFTYIFSATSSIGKQGQGYAESIGGQVQILDISKTNLGNTIWVELAEKLGKDLKSLFSLEHPDQRDLRGFDLNADDWLKVLKKNPSVLQNPILVNGDEYLPATTPSEILEFFGVDSAGLDKKPLGEQDETARTTEKEKFIEPRLGKPNLGKME